MEMKRVGRKFVNEVSYGVYVWKMPDGKIVGDDSGHFLSIAGMANDIEKMNMMRLSVAEYGITEGQPVFLSGHRKVSDEEYERQKARAADGLTPDDHDIPSLVEDLKFNGKR